MLKSFSVKNYKNFKNNIHINFQDVGGYKFGADCIANDLITKMLIYGCNATGKTNLGKALMDITKILSRLNYKTDGVFLNADSEEAYASFGYVFQFDQTEITYQYTRLENQRLGQEQLFVNQVPIYELDFKTKQYQFDNLDFINAETANLERYFASLDEVEEEGDLIEIKMPFLRWLANNIAFEKNSPIVKLIDYIDRMIIITASSSTLFRVKGMYNTFFNTLEEPEALSAFEHFLNVMGIECKLSLKKLPDGKNELYFVHERLVPFFENASSGTLALVELYRRFILRAKYASFIYLDEFDAFYHYEMAENLVCYFKEHCKQCQIIMTSHNTNLMTNRLMRPDCLFILSREGTLTALNHATERELREGHNLEKMYISGEFEEYE